jgi:hypothetical protein
MNKLLDMSTDRITYRKLRKYKYQLLEEYSVSIEIKKIASNDFLNLSADGTLVIKEKYAWDGPSGPTIDTKSFMRASLVHDALYQLMREEKLNRHSDRKTADKILKRMCKQDKMWGFRAAYAYIALRWFGAKSARSGKKESKVHYAPK